MILFTISENPYSQKEQHQVAHGLLRKGLSRRGMDLEDVRIAYTPLGKPFFTEYKDLHFNLSHCPTSVVVGLGKRPIGVDVEKIRDFSENAAHMAFSEKEKELLYYSKRPDIYGFSLWVLKESVIKLIASSAGPKMKSITFESLFLSDFLWVKSKKRLVYAIRKRDTLSFLYWLDDHLLGISVDVS